MECCVQRFTPRLFPAPLAGKFFRPGRSPPFRTNPVIRFHQSREPIFNPGNPCPKPGFSVEFISRRNHSSSVTARAGWLLGLGEKKQTLPEIVKAGDPVLHEPARDVPLKEIGSERIQKIIDEMVKVMRTAPGVGLAAPQIGIPLKVISKVASFSQCS